MELKSEGFAAAGRPVAYRFTLYDPINSHPLRATLVVVQPGIDRAAETHARAKAFHQKLHAVQADRGRHGHTPHGAAVPAAVPPGIVPRTNPDGSFTFSHAFDTPGEKTIRLKVYDDGREFTLDLPVSVPGS